ncbi:MAG: uroporphyrinogen-III C-methyltransferase [Motiliproteus sp.]
MKDKNLEQDNLQKIDQEVTVTADAVETEDATSDKPQPDLKAETPTTETTEAATDSPPAEPTEQDSGANDGDTVAEQTNTNNNANSEPDETQEEPKKGRSWIGVLAFFLAICALIVAGYGYQKIQLLQSETASLKSSTNGINKSLDSNLQQSMAEATKASQQAAAANSQIESLQAELATQQGNVNELQDRLTRSMKQVSQIGTNKRKDWLLAEVEYLLRLANQRVLMEKSPVGALALLQSSDSILKETDDVSIYNVRKAIANDIAALEAVPKLDSDGVFLKLAALNEQVSKLNLISIANKRELPELLTKVTPEAVTETFNQGIKTSWNQAMDKLGKLVVIQHRDEPIEPLLSPEQVYFLQQNLHLMIEQAQLSLLQGHQGSYDASLKKASDWVSRYFETDDSTTQSLLKGLKDLASVEVSPSLPDISTSLKALKAYLADVHSGKGAAG